MATTAANANTDGCTTVQVELGVPNSSFLPLDQINTTHVSSSIVESVKGISTHQLVLRSPTTDYVDTILRAVQSQGTPMVRYRIGVGVSGQTVFLPWQQQVITDITATIEGMGTTAGHFVRMSLKDILFTISRSTKVAAWRGTVSDIVEQIAVNNDISDTVVEPTVGEGLWIQSYVDDEDFIRKRMLHRAINAKGRGCYSFYVQDNVLHFHSPDYQAQLKQLVYYQANNLLLQQLDESQNMLEFGASGVRVIVYDPYTGMMGESVSDPAKALRLGNVITPLSQVEGADLHYPFHLSTNTVQEAQNIAQTVYENSRLQTLGLRLDIARSIFLRVGDMVQVVITPSGSKNSVWSGTYFVTNASYQVENGSMVSVFVVKRGEYQTDNLTPTTLTVLGENLVVNNQQAPGQPLNLQSTQSSTLTHGSGQSSYTSIYVTTQDPNTAPNPSPNF